MMKIIGGDWPAGNNALIASGMLRLHKTIWLADSFLMKDIARSVIVDSKNYSSVGKKLGWA